MLWNLGIERILLRIPIILLAISVHECAHGYMAYLLGDHTAKMSGRLSLNPLHHIDWPGLICMLLVGFGWASPVPVNPQYFKNPKGGMSLVGLAGPLSNLILAVIFTVLYGVLLRFAGISQSVTVRFFRALFETGITLNVGLAIFNLIPIPPLDGSKILAFFLPNRWYYKLMMYERYVMPVLAILLLLGILDKPFALLATPVIRFMEKIILLILGA